MNKVFLSLNSFSPSSHTMESIPSIFMSRNIKDIEYKNFNIFLTDHSNKKKNSISKILFFSYLRREEF